jgi:hypothetical protein
MEGPLLPTKNSQYRRPPVTYQNAVNMESRPFRIKKQSMWKADFYLSKNSQHRRPSVTYQKTVNVEGRPLGIKKRSVWKAVRYVSKTVNM